MRDLTILVTSISLVLLICGCPPTYPPPENPVETPVDLLANVDARLETIDSIRLLVVLDFFSEEGRAKVRQVILARPVEDLHIETLSPFDQPLSILVSNGEEFSLLSIEEKRFYYGIPTPENIARLLPVMLSGVDVVRVLRGGVPIEELPPSSWESAVMEWDDCVGAYKVTFETDTGRREVWVRHGDWVLRQMIWYDTEGEEIYRLETDEFEPAGEVIMPRYSRFQMEEGDIDFSLSVERIEVNVELPDDLFTLQPPRGVEKVYLE